MSSTTAKKVTRRRVKNQWVKENIRRRRNKTPKLPASIPCGVLFRTNPAKPKSVRKKSIRKGIILESFMTLNEKKYDGEKVWEKNNINSNAKIPIRRGVSERLFLRIVVV